MLRACVLVGACAGLVAACSDDDDSSSGTTGGKGGSAGSSAAGSSAQGGKSSGGSSAEGGKGGTAQGGKGGTAQGGKAGGGTSSAGEGGLAEAGTDAGGAGGQSVVGAGGEAGNMGEAGAGGSGADTCPVYDAKLVPVDQSQLGANNPDTWNLWESTGIGQFITSGKTGLLAAVELSIAAPTVEKVGTIEVWVYDVLSNTKLGQASVSMSALAGKNGGGLAADKIGPAFFDFSGQCIHVTAAQKLRIDVHPLTGMCDDLHCVGGFAAGNNCTTDAQCSSELISASQPSTYAGGTIAFKGVAGSADDNLNFKTFVAN